MHKVKRNNMNEGELKSLSRQYLQHMQCSICESVSSKKGTLPLARLVTRHAPRCLSTEPNLVTTASQPCLPHHISAARLDAADQSLTGGGTGTGSGTGTDSSVGYIQ